MNQITHNPQNPYISCVVRASAGCGKTYQLSRRFLYLVSAGANPASILTITFTKKAASEMRERILSESANLLKSADARNEFNQAVLDFFRDAQKQSPEKMQAPKSAEQTAKDILSATQSLRISTIDATFLDWVRKFPMESKGDRETILANQSDLASISQGQLINKLAWEEVCKDLYGDDPQKSLIMTPLDLETRIQGLIRNQTFFWLAGQLSGDSFSLIPLAPGSEDIPDDIEDLIGSLKTELNTIAEQTSPKKQELILRAIQESSLAGLVSSKLLTKDLKVSGATIRGKKRDALAAEILLVDEQFSAFNNRKKINELNEVGSILSRLFKAFSRYRDRIKDRMGVMEFDDTAKGSYNLFASVDNLGARYLIHKHTSHILLDEFQDTSNLQWSIFKSVCTEMLSGQGLEHDGAAKPSVFIVGDEKQSIYGFREADAKILVDAASELKAYGIKEIPLNHSYRTSQGVLDLVNKNFSSLMTDFPEHQTARFPQTNSLAVPNHSAIAMSPLFEDKDAVEQEAEFVAAYIERRLKEDSLPVYDKSSKTLRPLEARDCAILYRASTHVASFEKALRKRGIQSRREENRGFFDRQEVRDIYHLLRFLCYQSDLLSFTAVMKSPIVQFNDKDLLRTLLSRRKTLTPRDLIVETLGQLEESKPDTARHISELMNLAKKQSPSETMIQILQDLNPVSHYKEGFEGAESAYAVANLQRFLDLIMDLQNQGCISLQQVLERLDECMREDTLGASSPSENAVNLMTIHKSKGLEFPLVAVIGLGEAWEKRDPYWVKVNSKDIGVSYVGTQQDRPKEDLRFDQLFQGVLEDDRMENQRLLYVALTRAKHHLLLSGSRRVDSKKDHGFHQHLWQCCEELTAKEKTLQEQPYLEIENNLDNLNLTPIERESSASQEAFITEGPKSKAYLEIKTLAPNRLLTKSDHDSEHDFDQQLFSPFSTEAGTYIHQALEHHIKSETYAASTMWESLYNSGELERFKAVGLLAETQVQKVLNSKQWQGLMSSGNKQSEMNILHLDGQNLIRGSIDLLVDLGKNRFLVIDYKTAPLKAGTALHQLCLEKGYDKQLLAYVKGIKALHPGSKVNGGVYFTHNNSISMTHQEFHMAEFDLDLGSELEGTSSSQLGS